MNQQIQKSIDDAARVLESAEAMMIGAGAGMGVDSGLPDFRGNEGFWRAYPAFRGKRFSEVSNPAWFGKDPQVAWGFFGHRYNLYSSTEPHAGFRILSELAGRMSSPPAIFTSNVDGQFQKAGFNSCPIVECHGSIHHLQCSLRCHDKIWPAKELDLKVNADIRLESELPTCGVCSAVARPNILMFGDYSWLPCRTEAQEWNYQDWIQENASRRVAVIEIGAGMAIPTVRMECESANGSLIRINPRDSDVGEDGIAIPLGALEALSKIKSKLDGDLNA